MQSLYYFVVEYVLDIFIWMSDIDRWVVGGPHAFMSCEQVSDFNAINIDQTGLTEPTTEEKKVDGSFD